MLLSVLTSTPHDPPRVLQAAQYHHPPQGNKQQEVCKALSPLQYWEGMGIGWGGTQKKAKKEIKDKIFVSSTLKWTPLVYTFTFI